jgi:UDP-glucose 4-epimerase
MGLRKSYPFTEPITLLGTAIRDYIQLWIWQTHVVALKRLLNKRILKE